MPALFVFLHVLILAAVVLPYVAVVMAMYRWLTSADVTWTLVWPGAVMTGVVYTALQFVGTNLMAARLTLLYGPSGVDAMRHVKLGFDPAWKLAPGLLFAERRSHDAV